MRHLATHLGLISTNHKWPYRFITKLGSLLAGILLKGGDIASSMSIFRFTPAGAKIQMHQK